MIIIFGLEFFIFSFHLYNDEIILIYVCNACIVLPKIEYNLLQSNRNNLTANKKRREYD